MGFFHDQVRHLHNHSHFRNLEEAHEQLVRDMILSHFGHSAVPTIMHHHFHHHHHHHMPLLDTAAETLDSVCVPLASLASLSLSRLAPPDQSSHLLHLHRTLARYICVRTSDANLASCPTTAQPLVSSMTMFHAPAPLDLQYEVRRDHYLSVRAPVRV